MEREVRTPRRGKIRTQQRGAAVAPRPPGVIAIWRPCDAWVMVMHESREKAVSMWRTNGMPVSGRADER
jgi:hypothetical protein